QLERNVRELLGHSPWRADRNPGHRDRLRRRRPGRRPRTDACRPRASPTLRRDQAGQRPVGKGGLLARQGRVPPSHPEAMSLGRTRIRLGRVGSGSAQWKVPGRRRGPNPMADNAENTLVAEPRTVVGSRPAGRLRREGKVPAVMYGLETETANVTV